MRDRRDSIFVKSEEGASVNILLPKQAHDAVWDISLSEPFTDLPDTPVPCVHYKNDVLHLLNGGLGSLIVRCCGWVARRLSRTSLDQG